MDSIARIVKVSVIVELGEFRAITDRLKFISKYNLKAVNDS